MNNIEYSRIYRYLHPNKMDYEDLYNRLSKQLTKEAAIKWAISCSYEVLPIFEAAYPADKRPREAIEAIEAYLKEPTDINAQAVCDATDTANDAAHAAYDAHATYATYATYAAHAAKAAAHAAYAAYADHAATANAAYYAFTAANNKATSIKLLKMGMELL